MDSGWTPDEIADELELDEREVCAVIRELEMREEEADDAAHEARHARGKVRHAPLTAREIIDAMRMHGNIERWGKATSQCATHLRRRVMRWRDGASTLEVERVRGELQRMGAAPTSQRRICGPAHDGTLARIAPPASRAELDADARHIRQWGYV